MVQTVTQAVALDLMAAYWDSATSVRLMLYNSATVSSPPTEAELFRAEVIEENGYTRNAIAPTTPAVWNAANGAAERTMQNSTVTALGGTITYDSYAIIRNGAASANKIAVANASINSFNVVGHGLATGDRVLITADPTATMPTGLDSLTFYYAQSVDADNFTLTDAPGGSGVAFTDAGTGTLRLRYAAGVAGWHATQTSTRTIDPAGDPHPFTGVVAFAAV